MKYISKSEYKDWENEIISRFYNKKHKQTKLIPTNNNPSHLRLNKYILIVDFENIKKIVSNKNVTKNNLPKKEKITMYHIGDKKKQKVSYGYDDEENKFVYPALDFGGLTNLKQDLGKTYRMNGSFQIDKDTSLEKLCNELYQKWKILMDKQKFYGNIKNGLLKWLQSLQLILKKKNISAILHFYKRPPKHRIVYTSQDILKHTGRYYVRIYGGKHYAKELKNTKYYTTIEKTFITTNINRMNLNNEYQKY